MTEINDAYDSPWKDVLETSNSKFKQNSKPITANIPSIAYRSREMNFTAKSESPMRATTDNCSSPEGFGS
jgi:hypothetical protein